MGNFWESWSRIPEKIDPVAFRLGDFPIGWYGLAYLSAFLTVVVIVFLKMRKEGDGDLSEGRAKKRNQKENRELIWDFLFFSFLSLIAGARIGYVIFYDFSYFVSDPIKIVSPFDREGNFSGIYGMSYHGGFLAVLFFSIFFCFRKKIDFWKLSDLVVPAATAGYFWGRMGNFLNGELYGRETRVFWGMYFPEDPLGLKRHPSQLYEAFLEGLLLFGVLWFLGRKKIGKGNILTAYIFGYGLIRFFVEFFRQSDSQVDLLIGFLTRGQVLSLAMIVLAVGMFYWRKKTENDTIMTENNRKD